LDVLVTGASGLIGRSVVRQLLSNGHAVRILQRGASPADLSGVRSIRADVTSAAAQRAAAGVEAVIHLAGRGDVLESWQTPGAYLRVLGGGTLNVLLGAKTAGAAVVVPSSQRVYRPSRRPVRENDALLPSDPYALGKVVAEGYCRLYAERCGLATRVVRLFSVYGPGQRGYGNSGVVAIFTQRAQAGHDLLVDAAPRRDLTYVDDAARGLCLALEKACPGFRIYNVATGRGTELRALAETIACLTGSSSRIVPPKQPWPGGHLVADIGRARRELGYEPSVTLEDGLRRVLAQSIQDSSDATRA
jgi:UDP-glucose 4-epimerase